MPRRGKTFPTFDPATGEVLAQVAEGDREDVERAVRAARRAFESGPWPAHDASERGRLLWKLADLVEAHGDELAELESLDNGKPRVVARAADVPLVGRLPPLHGGLGHEGRGQDDPDLRARATWRGRCASRSASSAQIIPWNFPLLMAAWKLGPALATGCTVVLKPAEQTPLSRAAARRARVRGRLSRPASSTS